LTNSSGRKRPPASLAHEYVVNLRRKKRPYLKPHPLDQKIAELAERLFDLPSVAFK
jgi:hypothetical protein